EALAHFEKSWDSKPPRRGAAHFVHAVLLILQRLAAGVGIGFADIGVGRAAGEEAVDVDPVVAREAADVFLHYIDIARDVGELTEEVVMESVLEVDAAGVEIAIGVSVGRPEKKAFRDARLEVGGQVGATGPRDRVAEAERLVLVAAVVD